MSIVGLMANPFIWMPLFVLFVGAITQLEECQHRKSFDERMAELDRKIEAALRGK